MLSWECDSNLCFDFLGTKTHIVNPQNPKCVKVGQINGHIHKGLYLFNKALVGHLF